MTSCLCCHTTESKVWMFCSCGYALCERCLKRPDAKKIMEKAHVKTMGG